MQALLAMWDEFPLAPRRINFPHPQRTSRLVSRMPRQPLEWRTRFL